MSNKYPIHAYETPEWLSYNSDEDKNANKTERQQHGKIVGQISILQKLRTCKLKDSHQIDITHKMKKTNQSSGSNYGQNYFILSNDRGALKQQSNSNSQNFCQNEHTTFQQSVTNLNKMKGSGDRLRVKALRQQRYMNRAPSCNRFLVPTQSWKHRITPQKAQKCHKPRFNPSALHPSNITVHQQLYLDSRKKEIKKSAQQIIQNQYFKKKHTFRPEIGDVSQFLAYQKLKKIKQRQQFQKQFSQFQDWKQQNQVRKRDTNKQDKQYKLSASERNKKQQKQTQLKNYTILKQFFFYLSEQQDSLKYPNLSYKKLLELPSPCLKMLQPIIQSFYKQKKNKQLNWLQFLSQFNLEVKSQNSFFKLIQKWFWLKYEVKFQRQDEQHQQGIDKQNKYYKQDSTCIGQSMISNPGKSHQNSSQKVNNRAIK